jgi:glucosylceramidase
LIKQRRKIAATGALIVCTWLASAAATQASFRPELSVGSAPAPTAVPVAVYLTDSDLAHAALTQEPDLTLSSAALPRRVRIITVDDRRFYQRILGFGAAITDASAWLIQTQLTPNQRRTLLTQLFSPTAGIGLNFMRVPIGSSDFTASGVPYSYDDLGVGQTDATLADFSIAHDEPYVIPVLQQMLARDRKIDLFASEWSPPAWMKANDALSNIYASGTLLPRYYQAFADYFVKFIRAYQSFGLPIWGIAPQNEPSTATRYPGMSLTGPEEAQIIEDDLAPKFGGSGVHTRIYAGETDIENALTPTVLKSPARRVVAGAAWHCYQGEHGLNEFHMGFPRAQSLVTECASKISPYAPAEAAIDSLRNWAAAFDMWNVALDQAGGPVEEPNIGCSSCVGLAVINDGATPFATRPRPKFTSGYYQLGQFSKFIQRGAVRIETPRWVHDSAPTAAVAVSPGIDNVALIDPDGDRVLVAYNNGSRTQTFGVSWHSLRFAYTLRARATVTFVWPGARPTRASACLNAPFAYFIDNQDLADSYAKPEC